MHGPGGHCAGQRRTNAGVLWGLEWERDGLQQASQAPLKTGLRQSVVGSNSVKPQLHSIAFHPGCISKGQSQFFSFFFFSVEV